ncbi:pre-rRNA-processing protein esf1 [Yamadazyma tenuis]|uniref:pre-rRNA-processing protein esf1 n=1 Tax=Candida tenuis TaxID=2315449 RepID=UPI00279A339B|nr:pre-rRNA-processing protein esf1 [Yamadazyma tenuis]
MAKDKGKSGHNKPITTDGRFSSVHSDPRFKLPQLKSAKVKVDERFSRKEIDSLNARSSGKKAKVDRYGRKIAEEESKFDKYFRESSSEEENSENSDQSDEDSDSEDDKSDEDSDDESNESDDTAVASFDRARGEGLQSSSESDSSSSEDSESEDEVEAESDIELEQGKPEEGEPSNTFAVVNMDWDNVQAVDLMATFVSFVPKTGFIESITVYPSEFGKEQMQKEQIEGPPKDLFKKKKAKKDDSDSDEEIDTKTAAGLERAAQKLYEEDDGEDYDSKALRRYQLQRLRYYYAVVKCDSVITAKNIYDNCDGTEYESTSNIFDLRYVPNGMEFESSEARDVCTKVPTNYKPSTFVTDALQHSKVKLTWDETPKERLAVSGRSFSQREIEEMDFKAYLASDSEDEEDQVSTKDKYKMLLAGKGFGTERKDSDDDVDMEISFNPGLDEEKAKAKNAEEMDTLTAYKLKQKERRKARMERFKEKSKDEVEEPETQTSRKNKKNDKNKNDKATAELELLMMNENDEKEDNHFNMKDIIKAEKKKGKKNKKTADLDIQDNFEVNLDDDRFNEIFEDRDYKIDPTNTDFKQTKTMKKILSERSKRQADTKNQQPAKKARVDRGNRDDNSGDVRALADKLKRKHKHLK